LHYRNLWSRKIDTTQDSKWNKNEIAYFADLRPAPDSPRRYAVVSVRVAALSLIVGQAMRQRATSGKVDTIGNI
jgi:hypothetical protein